jgi:hypothetical protein
VSGGDDHGVVGVPEALVDEVVDEGVHRRQVVNGEAEEPLDLADVQVHRHHPLRAGDPYHVGHEPCRYGLAGLGLSVLARVGEPRDDRGYPLGRGPLGGIDHDEELHEVAVDRLTEGLDDKDVGAPHGVLVAGVHLAAREPEELHAI